MLYVLVSLLLDYEYSLNTTKQSMNRFNNVYFFKLQPIGYKSIQHFILSVIN